MRRVYDYYENRLEPYNLTPSQFFVFNALRMKDGIAISELGEMVALDNSTLTGIIDRMEKSGYLKRRINPDDRRSIRVFLTPKAKRVGPDVVKLADELDNSLRKGFSEKEMVIFESVLKDIAAEPELVQGRRGEGSG
jgi:DNA-binding MarR family transcriptional regulator